MERLVAAMNGLLLKPITQGAYTSGKKPRNIGKKTCVENDINSPKE
jgi:hypothetical protein